jgi:hypothetical protein
MGFESISFGRVPNLRQRGITDTEIPFRRFQLRISNSSFGPGVRRKE